MILPGNVSASAQWSIDPTTPDRADVAIPLTLRVPADAPRTLTLAGPEAVTVMWLRDGNTTATLPLYLAGPVGGSVSVALNDRAFTISLPARGEPLPGPTALPSEAAYGPVMAWRPSRSIRRPVVMLCLLLLAGSGILLLRRSIALPSLVIVVAMLLTWLALQPSSPQRLVGDVLIRDGKQVWRDRWTWLADAQGQRTEVAARGETWPVAFDRSHFALLQPTLHLDAIGKPLALELNVPRGGRVAVVSRQRLSGEVPGDVLPPPPGLIQALYRLPGWTADAAGVTRSFSGTDRPVTDRSPAAR